LNNAGTGHSAFELNYTPQKKTVALIQKKAISIAESFEARDNFVLPCSKVLLHPKTL
jgi:L-2-hydroxyglutarate oxidase LhgO